MKIFRPLAVLAGLIFCLIVVGGVVRNLGAGLSCPDWPLCQGRIIPQFDIRVFAEYFHRLFAALVSILILSLSAIIFYKKDLRARLGKLAGLALVLLFSQVLLGGITVLKLLQWDIVTLHLATGTLFFGTVLVMALKSKNGGRPFTKSHLLMISCLALGVLYIQILLGGVVSSHYAGLACVDFPTCRGEWWPFDLDSNAVIQFIHRLGATTVFIVLLYYAFTLFKNKRANTAYLVLALLCFQIILGIGNVFMHLPVSMSVAHLAVAEALFALLLISTYEIGHSELR